LVIISIIYSAKMKTKGSDDKPLSDEFGRPI